MTRKDVRKHLGEPLRIESGVEEGGAVETWRYEYETVADPSRRANGEVRLCGNDGRLLAWSEPDWSTLTEPPMQTSRNGPGTSPSRG